VKVQVALSAVERRNIITLLLRGALVRFVGARAGGWGWGDDG
jgi:hypothetical protein